MSASCLLAIESDATVGARAVPGRVPHRAFFAGVSLLFSVCAAGTIVCCESMPSTGAMRMPGDWTLSMAWMPMPGQTWFAAAGSFLGMWLVMMVAMMLPSLTPTLLRYREAIGRKSGARLGRLTTLVGLAYFLVWAVCGMAVFPLGAALATTEMRQPVLARIVPLAAAAVLLIAGALQFTDWKTRRLLRCQGARGGDLAANGSTAFRHGLLLGIDCCCCCANLTAILVVTGIMDLRAMAMVTAAVTVERLAAPGKRVAQTIGAIMVGKGLFLVATIVTLGWLV